ncbi:hypothetical protein BGZ73_001126 [Actinomortierella ambigua]|nr:hypothetical protein BGZ73_001126 [Actinomortierella ambigua]
MSEKEEAAVRHESSPLGWLEPLKRFLAPFKSIATTITMASVMTGIIPLTQEGLTSGGPVLMSFGFAVTGLMILMVALSLAEIASGFPGIKGGLVEYTRRLSPQGHLWQRLVIWHAVGTVAVLITVIAAQSDAPSITWVFTHFENQTGWSNNGAFTFTGYDGPIHTEYNQPDAARKVPQGILVGFVSALAMGEILILTLLFAISDLPAVLDAEETGVAGLEIFYLLLGDIGCRWILVVFLGTFFFCAQAILLVASEIGHELAMHNVLPWSSYFAVTNKRGQPERVGWVVSGIVAFVGTLYLVNETALIALTSVVAIELNIVYTFPALTRLAFPDPDHTRCPQGPFSLGRWSKVVDTLAVGWTVLATVIFCFPTAYPITSENMNYAIMLLTITFTFIFGLWFYSGRHWYGRPTTQRDNDDDDDIVIVEALPIPGGLDTLDDHRLHDGATTGAAIKELDSDIYRTPQHRPYDMERQQQQPQHDARGLPDPSQSPLSLQHLPLDDQDPNAIHALASFPADRPRERDGDESSVKVEWPRDSTPMRDMQHFVLSEEGDGDVDGSPWLRRGGQEGAKMELGAP